MPPVTPDTKPTCDHRLLIINQPRHRCAAFMLTAFQSGGACSTYVKWQAVCHLRRAAGG